jgi:hypothetical protein
MDVQFGASSNVVAIGYVDGSADLRSTSNGKVLLHVPALPCSELARFSQLCSVSVNLVGTPAHGLFTVTFGKRTRSWDLQRGVAREAPDLVTAADAPISDISMSDHSLAVITGAYDTSTATRTPTIHIYGRSNGGWKERRQFVGVPTDGFVSEAISPTAPRLVEATQAGMAMYDLTSGRTLWTNSESLGENVWFSSDGQTIYTDSSSGSDISAWSALDGTFQFRFNVTSGATPLVLRDTDGRLSIAALAGNDHIEFADWRVDIAALVDAACREANRNLTAGEWTRYIGGGDRYAQTCPGF